MQKVCAIVAAILFSCGAIQAQGVTGTPGMGGSSPLGIPGSTGSYAGTGIPLGATEINPGGLSPAPSANCSSTNSGSSVSDTNSTFDGGGYSPAGSVASTSNCASPTVSSTGTASPLSTSGSNSGLSQAGSTIPLGATEIDSGGVSPLITVSPPTSTTTPCVGSAGGC